MLGKRDLGFPSPVFLVLLVVAPVIVFVLRRKWQQSLERSEEIKRLLVSASEESARVEFQARESYYYTSPSTPSTRDLVWTPSQTYTSVSLISSSKPQYQCAVCFRPTTTRCSKCKAVRYCSGKCQIVHWRQGHKDECRPYRQGDRKDDRDSFNTEVKQTATATTFSAKQSNLVNHVEKSTGSRDNHQKTSNLSDEDTQSGASRSSFWTDDGSNESSSLSKPSTNSFDSCIDEHDDVAPGRVGEAENGLLANHTANVVSNSNIMGELGAEKVIDGSVSESKRSNDITEPTKGVVNNKKSNVPEKSNDVFCNKSTTPNVFKPMEVVSSLSKALDTYSTTVPSRNVSRSTNPMKAVVNDSYRISTCSSQLTEASRSGSKTSKLKVVDHLEPSKLSRQDTTYRYNFKGLFPYELFIKLYNWKQVELHPFGLKNCGNSCYANAVLQCLVYTPPLTAYLLERLHSKACDKSRWCFTCEFEGLVMRAKDGWSPLSAIRMLTHIENIGSNLGHGKEEDAHEFLRYVIDAMQSVCIKESRTRSLSSLEEETTLIGLTFGGYLRSKIICMKCGGKSEQHERIMDLTVEIEGDIRKLEEALDKFTCTEILDGENKYNCNRCKSYEKAKKKLTLLEAPNVLTIALKRFQSGEFGKLNKSVHFPEILDMAPYVSGTSDKSPIYRLYGVVVHVDTMNAAFSGHYVSYVKNLQNQWFKFDDTTVNEVDLQHVLTKAAYMLLYARCSPRAPRSIRSSLIHRHDDPRKHKPPPTPPPFVSNPHSTEPWDACSYHHRGLDEECSSSDNNSGFFTESCSCSTERDSSSVVDHISGEWEPGNINPSSSDSETSSSSSSFPSPRLSRLYSSTTNGEDDTKVCRNLDCSCSHCRITNLDRLGGSLKPSRKSTSRGKLD